MKIQQPQWKGPEEAKGPKFWGRRDTQHSWSDIWRGRQPSTRCFSTKSHWITPLCFSSRQLLVESGPSFSGSEFRRDSRSCGGFGLKKATRVSGPAHWASWADCLPMIHARHPLVATVLHHLEGAVTPCLSEAREIVHGLVRVGFEPPSWRDVVAGARPSKNEVEEFEWECGAGWQHEAGARVERQQRLAHLPSRGEKKVWNAAGIRPAICDVLERVAQEQNQVARVSWTLSSSSKMV